MGYINFVIFCQIVSTAQPRVSQMFLLREKNYPVNFMLATAAGYEYGKSSILNAFGVPALGFSRQTLLTYTEKKRNIKLGRKKMWPV